MDCGNEIDERNEICHGCGERTDIHKRKTMDTKLIADNLKKKYSENICQHCGNTVEYVGEKEVIPIKTVKTNTINTKKSGIAAVLSFLVPGLGQIYRGRIVIGSTFLVIGLVLIQLNRLMIEEPNFRRSMPDIRDAVIPGVREYIPDIRIILFIIIYILFWIYNTHHAYTINNEDIMYIR